MQHHHDGAAQLTAGVAFDLDYLGAGPLRLTPTKDSGREPLGVDGYPTLVRATMLPVVAIGDVTPGCRRASRRSSRPTPRRCSRSPRARPRVR
ncbi:thiamine phosphate synthase [Brachybacterium sp. UMB0905]|uniref:thiamine phosphate synthase n=1 Tax=Brachybacterium sp. Marseille-Q7125 TaxID=2932815 RepID=UPI001E61861D|nr:thiamine phosphate synthase [Brachybacterium sp. UMB0905]